MADKAGKSRHSPRRPRIAARKRQSAHFQNPTALRHLKRHKQQTHHADQHPENISVDRRVNPRRKQHAGDRTDDHALGRRAIPLAPIRLQRGGIDQHEQWQNDTQRSPRRHHQRQNRPRDKGRPRAKSAFGNPPENDRRYPQREKLPVEIDHIKVLISLAC